MIGLISETHYPHIRVIASFGYNSLSHIAVLQRKHSEIRIEESKASIDNFSRLKDYIENNFFLSYLNKTEVVDDYFQIINANFSEFDSMINVVGLAEKDNEKLNMFYGTPTSFYIKIISDFGEKMIFLKDYFSYYDRKSEISTIGLEVNIKNGYSVNECQVKGNIIPEHIIARSSSIEKALSLLGCSDYEILGYQDSVIKFKGDLILNEKYREETGLVVIDTNREIYNFIKILSESQLVAIKTKQLNDSLRQSIMLKNEIIGFSNSLSKKLQEFNFSGSNALVVPKDAISAYRNFKLNALTWKLIIDKGSYSYDLLKDCLNISLSFSDSLSGVRRVSLNQNLNQLTDSFVSISKDEKEIFELDSKRVKFSFDENIVDRRDIVENILVKDNVLQEIKKGIVEANQRIFLLETAFINDYPQKLSELNALYAERLKCVNTMILANAAAKTYLEQRQAIMQVAVRSWWNNALMGDISSFVTLNEAKMQYEFNSKRAKEVYDDVSCATQASYNSCAWWVILRSGSSQRYRQYEGRTKDECRYDATEYPLSTASTILDNLGMTYSNESPITAMRQTYTSCGKTQVIVEPVKQVARPKVNLEFFSDFFIKKLNELVLKNKQLATSLVELEKQLKIIDEQIAKVSYELGLLESQRFEIDEIKRFLDVLTRKKELLDRTEKISFMFKTEDVPNENEVIELNPIQIYELECKLSLDDIYQETKDSEKEEEEEGVVEEKPLQKIKEVVEFVKNINLSEKIKFDGESVKINQNNCFEIDITGGTITIKVEIVQKEDDICTISLKPVKFVSKRLETSHIYLNGYEANVSDIALISYCLQQLNISRASKKLKNLVGELFGMDQIEVVEMLNSYNGHIQELVNKFDISDDSKLSYLIFQANKIRFADILLLFESNSVEIASKYGSASAAFVTKVMEGVYYAN